jgi:hypothetical protein
VEGGGHPAGSRLVRVGQFVQYVDEGTQYSPENYPPTARACAANVAPAAGAWAQGSPRTAEAERERAKKRKERSVEAPRPEQMSESAPSDNTPSSSRDSQQTPSSAPNEPSLRNDPTPSSSTAESSRDAGSRIATNLPTQAAGKTQMTPQEARSTLSAASSNSSKRARPDDAAPVKIMPRAYETCNPRDLGVLISNMLMELIRLNDQIPLRDGRLTRFHSRAPPGISVSDYLQRLIQHATLPPPILLSMVYLIDRLCAMYAAFTINSLTVHRFLITAATVAAKGLSDSFWTNPTYARIGGIPVTELATLELELLQRVGWRIVPKPETLVGYYEGLIERTDGWELERSESDSSTSLEESGGENEPEDDQPMAEDPSPEGPAAEEPT